MCVCERENDIKQGNHKFHPKTVKLSGTIVPLPRLVLYNLISINIEVGIHSEDRLRISIFYFKKSRYFTIFF